MVRESDLSLRPSTTSRFLHPLCSFVLARSHPQAFCAMSIIPQMAPYPFFFLPKRANGSEQISGSAHPTAVQLFLADTPLSQSRLDPSPSGGSLIGVFSPPTTSNTLSSTHQGWYIKVFILMLLFSLAITDILGLLWKFACHDPFHSSQFFNFKIIDHSPPYLKPNDFG